MNPGSRERRAGSFGQRIVLLPRRKLVRMIQQRPVLRGLTVVGAGYHPRARLHLRRRPKGLDETILIYCVRGSGWCELENKAFPVEQGDLLVVPARVPHAYGASASNPWTVYWLQVTGELLSHFERDLGVSVQNPVVPLGEDLRLVSLFEEIIEAIQHDYAYLDVLEASQAAAYAISRMVRRRHERGRNPLDPGQKVAQSVAYLKAHLDRPLKVDKMASLVNLSPSRFSSVFHQATGSSPHQYLNRLRIHRALQLLDTTTLAVKEIAASLGYRDQFHFSNSFKAIMKVPPTTYRARKDLPPPEQLT